MKILLPLVLVLALVAPVGAGENYYEYVGLDMLTPQTCTSPCHVDWIMDLRGIPLLPVVRPCQGGPRIVRDEYITVYASGANLPEGKIRLTIGDTHPWNRTQTYCAVLLYLPLAEEKD